MTISVMPEKTTFIVVLLSEIEDKDSKRVDSGINHNFMLIICNI